MEGPAQSSFASAWTSSPPMPVQGAQVSGCPSGWADEEQRYLGVLAGLLWHKHRKPARAQPQGLWGSRGIRLSYNLVQTRGPEPVALSAQTVRTRITGPGPSSHGPIKYRRWWEIYLRALLWWGGGTALKLQDQSLRPGSATSHLGVPGLGHPCPTQGGAIHRKRCPQSTTTESQGPHFPICKMGQLLLAGLLYKSMN